jgi:hypothetical protein
MYVYTCPKISFPKRERFEDYKSKALKLADSFGLEIIIPGDAKKNDKQLWNESYRNGLLLISKINPKEIKSFNPVDILTTYIKLIRVEQWIFNGTKFHIKGSDKLY